MERQVYKSLVRDSGMSQSSLQRLFDQYLSAPPKNILRSKNHVHLLIDGTYFTNGLCLVLYYDNDIQYVQLFRETNKEKYREIKEDLGNLKSLGVQVYSVIPNRHLNPAIGIDAPSGDGFDDVTFQSPDNFHQCI